MIGAAEPWPPTAAHLDAVMAVMETGFPARWGERWTRSQLSGLLAGDPQAWMLVVHRERALAGFALARRVVDTAELMLLAVDPAHRRRGFARALLRGVVERAASGGATSLFAEVRQGNDAEQFYRAHGFVVTGRRPHYYRSTDGGRHDAMTMRLSLE